MSVGVESQPSSSSFNESTKVPINQLNPNADANAQAYVAASVVLIWPYSSSTQQISLLLAEKDIRLRKSKGQVKVTFNGVCAREVARSHVGIGDSVNLGLRDAVWKRTGEQVSTPGKKVDWDIVINKRAKLEVEKADGNIVAVDVTAQSPPPSTDTISIVEIDGPRTNGFIDIRKSRPSGTTFSPARRVTHKVSSGSFVDASLDPFADDDGYVSGKGRKRTKFSRHSGSWQLLDREDELPKDDDQVLPSSPLGPRADEVPSTPALEPNPEASAQEAIILDAHSVESDASRSTIFLPGVTRSTEVEGTAEPLSKAQDGGEIHDAPDNVMGPPPIPSPVTPRLQLKPFVLTDELTLPAPTPVLRPLPSPGLALVSPLVERSGLVTGYFPSPTYPQSGLDASSHAEATTPTETDDASAVAHADTTEPIQQDRSDPDILVATDGHVQGLVFPSDDINDVLQSGQGLEQQHIDGVIDLPLDPGLDAGLLRDNDVIPMPPIHDYVDLDALQEQIEATSNQLHEHIQSPRIEDDDMYGPAIIPQPQDMHSSSQDESRDDIGMGESLLQLPVSQSSPRNSVPLSHSSSTQLESQLLDSAAQLAAQPMAVVIDSSSDEAESDLDDVEQEEDEGEADEEADEIEHETTIEAVDLEEELERELAEDEILGGESETIEDGVQDVRELEDLQETVNVQPPADLLVPTPLQPPPVEDMMYETMTRVQGDSTVADIDGMRETYETEAERDLLRASMTAAIPVTKPDEIDIGGSPPGSGIPVNNDGELAVDSLENSEDYQQSDGVSEVNAGAAKVDQNVSVEDNDADRRIQQALGTDAEESSKPQSHQGNEPLPYMITPDATQQSVTVEEPVLPPITQFHPALPMSPILTQNRSDRIFVSSPTAAIPSQEIEDEVGSLLPAADEREGEKFIRTSKRLSRKSFGAEVITTEYFTPRRSLRVRQSSPSVMPEPPSTVQQLSSPTKPKRVLRSSSPDLVRQLDTPIAEAPDSSHGTTTTLSYYPRLSALREHFNHQVDIIAVCSADSAPAEKAKLGPKDHYTTLFLADPSFTGDNTTMRAQVFRPQKKALPVAMRGDVVLLRNMKVQTQSRKVMLLSTDSSAWAVFKQGALKVSGVAVTGPPVEYAAAERAEVKRLSNWWSEAGEVKYSEPPLPTSPDTRARETRSNSPRITRSQRRKANMTDNSGNAYEQDPGRRMSLGEILMPSSPPPMLELQQAVSNGNLASPTVPLRRSGRRRADSGRSESLVHELRDGTTYVDDDGGRRSTSVVHELRDGSTYIDE